MKPKLVIYYNRVYILDHKRGLALSSKAINSASSTYDKMRRGGKFKKPSVFERIARFFDKPRVNTDGLIGVDKTTHNAMESIKESSG